MHRTSTHYGLADVPRPDRLRGVAHRGQREHPAGVRPRRRRVRRVVRAGRMPRCGRTRPSHAAPLSRLPADPRVLAADDRAQGRVGPRPTCASCGGAGVLTNDVAAAVRTPKGPRRLPRMPRRPEAAALLDDLASEAAADSPVAVRNVAVVELLYGAGLRVSECCGLDVDDVDLRRANVTVLGKGAKVRRAAARRAREGGPAPLSPDGPAGARRRRVDAGAVREHPRPSDDARDVRRILDRHRSPDGRSAAPPRPAPRLRDPSARGGSRSQSCSGAPRTRRCGNNTDLHSRDS